VTVRKDAAGWTHAVILSDHRIAMRDIVPKGFCLEVNTWEVENNFKQIVYAI
jgi:hypothetical protein